MILSSCVLVTILIQPMLESWIYNKKYLFFLLSNSIGRGPGADVGVMVNEINGYEGLGDISPSVLSIALDLRFLIEELVVAVLDFLFHDEVSNGAICYGI